MKTSLCGFLVAALAVSSARAEPLTIVENGVPRAAVVVAAGEPKAEEAAAEIQRYVEKMSGAKLPILKEGDAVAVPISILVGHTAAAQKLGVTVPSGYNPTIRPEAFEEEGFVIKTAGKSLVVGGNSDGPYQGTIYAACELLERLGCRWYFPGEWGEVVPEQKTLSVPDLDVKTKPDFVKTFIQELPVAEYPYFAEHAQQHMTKSVPSTGKSEFEFGLDLILDGLEKMLGPARKPTHTRARKR